MTAKQSTTDQSSLIIFVQIATKVDLRKKLVLVQPYYEVCTDREKSFLKMILSRVLRVIHENSAGLG